MEWSPLKTTIEEVDPLKVAAMLAVMQMIEENNTTHSNSGRLYGTKWSQDHKRMLVGQSSVLQLQQSRSTFR